MTAKLWATLRAEGLSGLLRIAYRKAFKPVLPSFTASSSSFTGTAGLEIGGPSHLFHAGSLFPIYPLVASLDQCNYGAQTLWSAQFANQNRTTDSIHPPGRRLIHEATALSSVSDESYDFLLASHVLEHVANPLKALREWVRVVKAGGILVLVVPHHDGSFDRYRPITTLDHLIEDCRADRTEDDATHIEEVIALHDLKRDPETSDRKALATRCRDNLTWRSVHHHVFSTRLFLQTLDQAGIQIVAVDTAMPYHIVALGQRLLDSEVPKNAIFLGAAATWRACSPFPTDRLDV